MSWAQRKEREECTPGMCVETSAALPLGDRGGGFCVCA